MENLNTDVNRSNLMALLNFCTIFTALILVIPHNNTAEERVFQLFALRRFQTITSLTVLANMLISKLFAPLTLPGSDGGGGGGGGGGVPSRFY